MGRAELTHGSLAALFASCLSGHSVRWWAGQAGKLVYSYYKSARAPSPGWRAASQPDGLYIVTDVCERARACGHVHKYKHHGGDNDAGACEGEAGGTPSLAARKQQNPHVALVSCVLCPACILPSRMLRTRLGKHTIVHASAVVLCRRQSIIAWYMPQSVVDCDVQTEVRQYVEYSTPAMDC